MTKTQLIAIEGFTIVNETIIYDPFIICSEDLKAAYPDYRLIRVRRPKWGQYNAASGDYIYEPS